MTDNKNSALSVLLILIMVTMIGALAFRLCTNRADETEVKTTMLSGSNVVERTIREFEAKSAPQISNRVAEKLRSVGYSTNVFSTVNATVGNPAKQP